MKAKISKTYIIFISLLTAVAAAVSISGCGNQYISVFDKAVCNLLVCKKISE